MILFFFFERVLVVVWVCVHRTGTACGVKLNHLSVIWTALKLVLYFESNLDLRNRPIELQAFGPAERDGTAPNGQLAPARYGGLVQSARGG